LILQRLAEGKDEAKLQGGDADIVSRGERVCALSRSLDGRRMVGDQRERLANGAFLWGSPRAEKARLAACGLQSF
jgi:hypothetical protein